MATLTEKCLVWCRTLLSFRPDFNCSSICITVSTLPGHLDELHDEPLYSHGCFALSQLKRIFTDSASQKWDDSSTYQTGSIQRNSFILTSHNSVLCQALLALKRFWEKKKLSVQQFSKSTAQKMNDGAGVDFCLWKIKACHIIFKFVKEMMQIIIIRTLFLNDQVCSIYSNPQSS